MKYIIFGFFIGFFAVLSAQIPNMNSSDRLDVATWNVEWFGSSTNGPTNNDRQLQYASDIINTLDLDILALQEISDVAYWNRLLFNCSNYTGVLSTWSQTQKTAIMFKKSEFEFLYQKHILANYDYDFGSGRLPLEVGLIPKHANWPAGDTLRIWVLHMKANTGSSSQKVLAYNRRYNAGVALKMYIDNLGRTNKGLVLGDWNDDFDQSILSGYATPYQNWMKDTQYAVTSYPLSLARDRSTVGYSDMIDHIACSPGMKSHWVSDSSAVLYADKWVSNYENVLSDHYPVYSRFTWESAIKSLNAEVIKSSFSLVLVGDDLLFLGEEELGISQQNGVFVYDMLGRLCMQVEGNRIANVMRDHWFGYAIKSVSGEVIRTGMFLVDGTSAVSYR